MSFEYTMYSYDPQNVRRVYGSGPMPGVAASNAHKSAQEYLNGRPDTGPLCDWRFFLDTDPTRPDA